MFDYLNLRVLIFLLIVVLVLFCVVEVLALVLQNQPAGLP